MSGSGFSATEFASRHTTPYTRIAGEDIELPVWDGQGMMMHTTAEDMARFLAALMNGGRYGDFQLLQRETIIEMQRRTTRFTGLSFFKGKDDLVRAGHGLGLFVFRGGWVGHGGSAPGFQCLFRYNPSKQVGYVIMSNVNAILGGGDNYASARSDLFEVQDGLISILDPLFGLHRLTLIEVAFLGVVGAYIIIVVRLWARRRNAKRPGGVA
jgi:CubicO group peptidase (beta-lactamase class C family)